MSNYPSTGAYYLEPKAARHTDSFQPRRELVTDALRDLNIRYYSRERWRGPIPRSWRTHGRKQGSPLIV